uniref:Uncharacterized protein n=1 Tax=Lygus hesperus TaxID=30085 RepID=A0A146MFG4_LYGHE
MTTAPSKEAMVFAALRGLPLEWCAKDCYNTPCEEAVTRLSQQLLHHDTIGTTRRTMALLNSTAIQLNTLCDTFRLYTALEKSSESLTRTLQRNLLEPVSNIFALVSPMVSGRRKAEMELDRAEFFKSSSIGK